MVFYICWDMSGDFFFRWGGGTFWLGRTFWSSRGQIFVKFGMSWDVSGSGLGTFSDGFGRVWGKMFEGSKNNIFQKCPGVCSPSRGAS